MIHILWSVLSVRNFNLELLKHISSFQEGKNGEKKNHCFRIYYRMDCAREVVLRITKYKSKEKDRKMKLQTEKFSSRSFSLRVKC